jgi:hypothetical protein
LAKRVDTHGAGEPIGGTFAGGLRSDSSYFHRMSSAEHKLEIDRGNGIKVLFSDPVEPPERRKFGVYMTK